MINFNFMGKCERCINLDYDVEGYIQIWGVGVYKVWSFVIFIFDVVIFFLEI